jgi:hypothetical protein
MDFRIRFSQSPVGHIAEESSQTCGILKISAGENAIDQLRTFIALVGRSRGGRHVGD